MSKRNKMRFDKMKQVANQPVIQAPEAALEIPRTPPPEPLAPVLNSRVTNGFADAIGFNQGFGGQNGFPGGFSGQQVEDTTTIFENLRWYMVSNFRQLLSQAFVEIGLVQTICCVPVDDALRGGVLIKSKQLDEEEIKELITAVDRNDDLGTVGWAAKWEALFGGAGIIIMVDDQDPEEPLDLKSIDENSDVELRDVDMWELFQDKQNIEGFDQGAESQLTDYYDYYGESVHKSRVMKLAGMKVPSFIRPRLRGWGMSKVEALVRSMNQYLKATDLGFEVLDEFKLDIYKIKNLVNSLLLPNGTAKIKERVQLANWQKNYQNAVVMDAEDDFDHKQLSFAGLAEAMEGIRRQIAADMRMPLSKLFGTAEGGGIAATDGNDIENYNSMVESEVRVKIKYHIVQILEIRCQQLFGYIPDDLEIEFKPLRELSAIDQEAVKTQKWTRVKEAKAMGELTQLEFRDICNKGNLFDVQLDTDEATLADPELNTEVDEASDEDDDGQGGDANKSYSESSKPVKNEIEIDVDKLRELFPKDVFTFSGFDKMKRFFNSPAFDKASYEADGGDSWIDPRRKNIFTDPMNVDEGLWKKAKEACNGALGEDRWQFIVWWYKKNGGKFT